MTAILAFLGPWVWMLAAAAALFGALVTGWLLALGLAAAAAIAGTFAVLAAFYGGAPRAPGVELAVFAATLAALVLAHRAAAAARKR